MLNKNSFLALLVFLFITNLFGCGSGGDNANFNAATGGNGGQLESISITPTNPTIAVNTDIQFTATGIYSDNTTKDLTSSVTWTSSALDSTNVAGTTDIAHFTGFSTSTADNSSALRSPGSTKATGVGRAKITAKWGNISGSTIVTVTPATLKSISITPVNPGIVKNSKQQFIATGTFSDNTTQDLTSSVTWASSASPIATVSNTLGSNGLATSVAAGTTTITASSGSTSGSTTLTVTPATLVSLAITPTNPNNALGTTRLFTAMGTYSDNTTQDLTTTVTWNSSNAPVATVSNTSGSNGLATSVTAGSTTITATSGSITASTVFTVNSSTLISIAITPTNPSIVLGTTRQFTATGSYSDGSTQTLTSAVLWSSSNTGVSQISNAAGSNGLATSIGTGSTTITATSGIVSGTTTLTVTPATLVSIAVTPTTPSIAKGTNQQFVATGSYSNGSTQTLTASVTWSSSNTGVAQISNASGSNGRATSVAAGTTTITATSGSISKSTTLTITPATLVSIAVTPSNPSIASGTSQQFVATGTYSDSSTQNLTASVTWSSSNTSVSQISNASGSNGLATGIAAGTMTISATSGSVLGTAALIVTSITSGTTLSWDPTTTNTDGSTLAGLMGYKIYYGTAPGFYTGYITVGNVTSVPLTTISSAVPAPGTYFLSVTAYDSNGNESDFSNEVSRSL